MALTVTQRLTGQNDATLAVYTTTTVTATMGAGYLAWIVGGNNAGTTAVPTVAPTTVTGMGMTWVKVTDVSTPNGALNHSLWRAFTATPTSGVLTATWPGVIDSFEYKIDEVTGQDTTGTNGSGMVRSANLNTFSGSVLNPSGVLPSAQLAGNRIITGCAYNAPVTQTLSVGTSNALALVSPVSGNNLNPAILHGVALGGNGTGWDWVTTNLSTKAIISVELVAGGGGSTSNFGTFTVTEQLSGFSSTAATVFTTGVASATAGAAYILWVGSAVNAAAVAPTSVTGMGMAWVKITGADITSGNANINLSAWRAYTLNPASTALTINYAATIGSVAWKLDSIQGMSATGSSGSGMIRATNVTTSTYTTTGNVSTSLTQTPNAGGAVISGAAYNASATQILSQGSSGLWALVGGPLSSGGNPSITVGVEGAASVSTTLDWNSNNASAKAVIILELIPAGVGTPLTVNASADAVFDGNDTATATATAAGGSGGTTYAWTEVTHSGTWTPSLTGASTATVSFAGQRDRTGNIVQLRVTATDSSGATATDTVVLTITPWTRWTRRAGVLVARARQTQRP